MNFLKRGIISVSRAPVKSVTFFLLLFILGSLVSGVGSIRQAIYTAERQLIDRLPAVAVLIRNMEAQNLYINEDEEWAQNQLTLEMVHQVGNLPHVRDYDVTLEVPNMFSRDLFRTLELSFDTSTFDENWDDFLKRDINSLRTRGFELERFRLKGISTPDLVEIQTEIMILDEGRLFTKDEIDNHHHVTLISRALAETNNLSVGSSFIMENIVFDYREQDNMSIWETEFNDEFIFKSESYEFEVVGIFEVDPTVDAPDENRDLQNKIFVPLTVVHDIFSFQVEGEIEIYGDFAQPKISIDECSVLHSCYTTLVI